MCQVDLAVASTQNALGNKEWRHSPRGCWHLCGELGITDVFHHLLLASSGLLILEKHLRMGKPLGDEHMNLAATWKEVARALWQGCEPDKALARLPNCFLVLQDHSKCVPWPTHPNPPCISFWSAWCQLQKVSSGQTKRNKSNSSHNACWTYGICSSRMWQWLI